MQKFQYQTSYILHREFALISSWPSKYSHPRRCYIRLSAQLYGHMSKSILKKLFKRLQLMKLTQINNIIIFCDIPKNEQDDTKAAGWVR